MGDLARDNENKVLLVGNPNVGKSVIFSFLTGRYAVVSNYPGTTVEIAHGRATFDRNIEVIDTPGVNSLFPHSEDEKVTRDLILKYRDSTVVQVADAKDLFRALLLTTQLAELKMKVILVLNMMDEARQRGIRIDTALLSKITGVRVIESVAIEKVGLPAVVSAVKDGDARIPELEVDYPDVVEKAIDRYGRELKDINEHGLFGVLTFIYGDERIFLSRNNELPSVVEHAIAELKEDESKLSNPFSYLIAASRNNLVSRIISTVEGKERDEKSAQGVAGRFLNMPLVLVLFLTALLYLTTSKSTLTAIGLHPTLILLSIVVVAGSLAGVKRLNEFTLNPVGGVLSLLIVLYLVYKFVGVFAAQVIVDFLENSVFNEIILPAIDGAMSKSFIKDFLVGEYGLVSVGLNYSISIVLPIVAMFFLVFGILEDSGYFPRMTILSNRVFRVVGLSGKATLPIVLGFGCVTMATLASRIMDTRKERIIVITLLALAVPCSAQMGVIMALFSAISRLGVVLLAIVIISEFLIVGKVLSIFLKGKSSDFIIDLPPLRFPKMKNIMLKTFVRIKWFFREAVPFFILATLILFILDKVGGIRFIYAITKPIIHGFLGLPVESVTAFIVGFFRRDFGAAGLYKLWESGVLAGNQVFISLVVMSLFIPCLATTIVIVKELGLKYSILIFLLVITLSILTGGILNFLLNTFNIVL